MWHSENTNVEYSDLRTKQSDARRGVQVWLQRYQDSFINIHQSQYEHSEIWKDST